MTAHTKVMRGYPPRLMGAQDAAYYLGVSITTLTKYGPRPKRIGARVLWDRRDLDRHADLIDGQPLTPLDESALAEDVVAHVAARLGELGHGHA